MTGSRWIAVAIGVFLLASCSDPVPTAPPPDAEVPIDDEFETAELRVGKVRTREVMVPAGYTLVDMNRRGDLLLGAAWLPALRTRPLALPFIGRSINNHRQILGPGRQVFRSGTLTEIPDPCVPIVGEANSGTPEAEPLIFDCVDRPVEISVLSENGDALAEWRQDARGTMWSPFRFFKVWREHSRDWESVVDLGLSESGDVDAVISDTGVIAVRVAPFPYAHVTSFVLADHGLGVDGICPPFGAYPSEPQAVPRAVNDAGEVVGLIDCYQENVAVTGVRWSRTGVPTRLDGSPSLIDNFGNAAGVRESDGHTVIWLVDGSAIDLTAAAGGQPVSVRKFLKRGQVFGFAGTKALVWRFGF